MRIGLDNNSIIFETKVRLDSHSIFLTNLQLSKSAGQFMNHP